MEKQEKPQSLPVELRILLIVIAGGIAAIILRVAGIL